MSLRAVANLSRFIRLKALDIIEGSSVPGKPGLYVLGCYDDRITFFSQQTRALNLVWALSEQNYLSDASRIAVIGGGAAGLTAASCIALAADHVVVDLYEARNELLELQSVSMRRSLDPHIYGWPERGSTLSNAELPILDWQAGPARTVRSSLIRDFLNIRSAVGQRLNVRTNQQITALTEVSKGFSLSVTDANGLTATAQYDVVLLAFGFGAEPSSVKGMQVESYWSDAGIPDKDLSGDSSPTFIVSGSGDGALIDLVAAATKTFDHAAMIRTISSFPGIEPISAELSLIDLEARASEAAGTSFDLLSQYDARILPKLRAIGIIQAVEDNVRSGLRLILQTRTPVIFSLQTAILNRLAAYLVMTIYGSARSSFRHICAPDLELSTPELGEPPSKLWFICDGERLGANKVFLRRGTDKMTVRAPFAALLAQYPAEHARWLSNHGIAVYIPRVVDAAREFFKGIAVRYSLPRAQYLEAAYPKVEINVQVEIDGASALWAGDVSPEDVASLWSRDSTDTKLFCPNSPAELGPLSLVIARIAIHADSLVIFGNVPRWAAFILQHTRDSDTTDDIPFPKILPIGTIGTQQSSQRLQPEHLANRLHAAMDRWVLSRLQEDIKSFLENAADPYHTIGFEVENGLRLQMQAVWAEWEMLLAHSQDRLSRLLRLIVCAQESRAIPGGAAAVVVGPKRYKHILKTTVAALAVASAWQKMSPADAIPGNLRRVRSSGEMNSGFACAADRIAGQVVAEACATFDWATDFVLLPLQSSSLVMEYSAQAALDRTEGDQPLITEISFPPRILLSADREFLSALRAGHPQLEAFLQKKESQVFQRLTIAIERHP